MNRKTENITHLIKLNIAEVDPEALVILYGSRARGDARKDSDWDILVLTKYPVTWQVEKKFRDHLYDLELETGEVLSLFVYSKEEWDTKHHIRLNGKIMMGPFMKDIPYRVRFVLI